MEHELKKDFSNKKIGIWGFGSTGKSALSFFSTFNCQISILESRTLSNFEEELIMGHNAQSIGSHYLPQFLEMNDFIFPSPGVDISDYYEHPELLKKWIFEVDLFQQFITKPVIGITGSIGKTTVTHYLTHILNALGKKAVAVGNIGKPMLDIISEQDQYDIIVAELSSFQLEHSQTFAPELTIATNFFPNHLDRHKDVIEYLEAKGKLFAHQTEYQSAIIPMDYLDEFWPSLRSQNVSWIGSDCYEEILNGLPKTFHPTNVQLICAALEHFDLPLDTLVSLIQSVPPLEHRVEYIATKHDISFYNDSKSTIGQSTLGAIERFTDKKVILFLGGLSKGVDRTDLIKDISKHKNISHVVCFGEEAKQLSTLCSHYSVQNSHYETLDDAFQKGIQLAQPHAIVLFSPSGSSFDLFNNYQERGNYFKQLVNALS